jgi:hypothetical protein
MIFQRLNQLSMIHREVGLDSIFLASISTKNFSLVSNLSDADNKEIFNIHGGKQGP